MVDPPFMLWMWTFNRGEGNSAVVDNSWKTATILTPRVSGLGCSVPTCWLMSIPCMPPTCIQLASAALNRIWAVVVTNSVSNDLIMSSRWSMLCLRFWAHLLKQIYIMNIRSMGSVLTINRCKAVSGRTVLRLVPVQERLLPKKGTFWCFSMMLILEKVWIVNMSALFYFEIWMYWTIV